MRLFARRTLVGGAAIMCSIFVGLIPAAAGKAIVDGRDALQRCSTKAACYGWTNTTGGNGMHGDSRYGHGIVGTTHANPNGFGPGSSGVYGRDMTPYGRYNSGVAGISTVGTGVYGHSIEGAGAYGNGAPGLIGSGYTFGNGFWTGVLSIGGAPQSACTPGHPCPPGFATTSNYPEGSGVKLFTAFDNAQNLLAYIDDSGNMVLAGQLYTSGMCKTGCLEAHQASGRAVVAYVPRQAMPSVEDFGQAQLVDGRGYVRLAADFAAIVDKSAHYLVFLTPHADSRGLYVTDETAAGFEVRESGGGRSTMTFDYRIVAKPVDANEPRLPAYRPRDLGKIAMKPPVAPR